MLHRLLYMDTPTIIATVAALLACASTIIGFIDRRDRSRAVVSAQVMAAIEKSVTALRKSIEEKITESERRINAKMDEHKSELIDGGNTFARYEERFANIQRELDIARQAERENLGRVISGLTKTLEEKSRRGNND